MVELEVVATSLYPLKRRVPVFCSISSVKFCSPGSHDVPNLGHTHQRIRNRTVSCWSIRRHPVIIRVIFLQIGVTDGLRSRTASFTGSNATTTSRSPLKKRGARFSRSLVHHLHGVGTRKYFLFAPGQSRSAETLTSPRFRSCSAEIPSSFY